MAGELAISAIELVLTGDTSTDDPMIDILLEPLKIVRTRNKTKRDAKIEAEKMQRIHVNKLDVIAEMHKVGMTQAAIAKKLGLTQQTVSNRMKTIRQSFPELLQEEELVQNSENVVQIVQTNEPCTNFVQDSTNKNEFVQSLQDVTSDTACTNFVPLVESEEQIKDQEKPVKKMAKDFYF